MTEEKEDKKLKVDGWTALIAAVLTGIAAIITAIGSPDLVQRLFPVSTSEDTSPQAKQIQAEQDEITEVIRKP